LLDGYEKVALPHGGGCVVTAPVADCMAIGIKKAVNLLYSLLHNFSAFHGMGDPLSVASAIIGIIAAAGKVAETLGPLASSIKDAKNVAREIRDQVEESRAILQALQKLFDDLEQSPRRRRELIQIDQLTATLCDGTVIFSDLEPLVVQLGTSSESLRSRVQWARKRDQLEGLVGGWSASSHR